MEPCDDASRYDSSDILNDGNNAIANGDLAVMKQVSNFIISQFSK